MSISDITFILPTLNGGGAERVAVNFIRSLDNKNTRITLVVFSLTSDLLSLIPDTVEVVDLKTGGTSRSFFSLIKFLRQKKPSVIFSTHSRIASLLMLIKPFVPSFKHIARLQNTPSLEKKHNAYGSLRRQIYSLGFRSADVVIAQTEHMLQDAVIVFGIDRKYCKVLWNPVDSASIDISLAQISNPFPSQEISAVASGRLAYAKGFDVLLNALPSVISRFPNFKLYILGSDNGEGERLKYMIDSLSLNDIVSLLGFQSNPYMYYNYADLFILSSRWEGFPNVLLENYYLNTPIVATRCVPIVEQLIQNGVNGYLCDPESVEQLSEAVCEALNLSRSNIDNDPYQGGCLSEILSKL